MGRRTRWVSTPSRVTGLTRRDVVRESAGYLVDSRAPVYSCPRCSTPTPLPTSQIGPWVMQSGRDELYTFRCAGCDLEVGIPVDLEELPSWSGNLRIVLGATLRERRGPDGDAEESQN